MEILPKTLVAVQKPMILITKRAVTLEITPRPGPQVVPKRVIQLAITLTAVRRPVLLTMTQMATIQAIPPRVMRLTVDHITMILIMIKLAIPVAVTLTAHQR